MERRPWPSQDVAGQFGPGAYADWRETSLGNTAGAIYYPRSKIFAGLMAPLDPRLGELTTLGAAFLAVRASKA
jgi:hypothetical protein